MVICLIYNILDSEAEWGLLEIVASKVKTEFGSKVKMQAMVIDYLSMHVHNMAKGAIQIRGQPIDRFRRLIGTSNWSLERGSGWEGSAFIIEYEKGL